MPIVEHQPISSMIPVYILAMFYGKLTSLSLLWNLIRLGPSKFFGQRTREDRPDVLDDPQYGTHHFARLKNIRLHYVAKGPEDRPLVLFLHGFPEFWYSWRHQLKEFGKNYRAVALDMRGYGESEKPASVTHYHTTELVADIKNFIEHLGYKKCTLVVHDWGGTVGWLFATNHPEYVEKFIACNIPHPAAMQKHMWNSLKQIRMSWYVWMFQTPYLPELVLRNTDQGFLDLIFSAAMRRSPDTFTVEDLEAFKYTFRNYGDIHGPINYYRAVMRYKPGRMVNKKVQAPTMIIWGCKDFALDIAMVEQSKKYINNECTVKYIKEASHWVQQEEPVEVNNCIWEFLPE